MACRRGTRSVFGSWGCRCPELLRSRGTLARREIVDDREPCFVAARLPAHRCVLAVDDDRRRAGDAIAPDELFGPLHLGVDGERTERALERCCVDAVLREQG